MLSEEEFSLSGITITFNSGTTISVKRALPGVLLKCYAITKERRGIHVFSNISQSLYLYQGFVRMNLGIDGLFKIIRSQMKELSPISGDIFLFFGKNRQSVKILRWMVMAFSCTTSVWKVEVLSCRHLTPIQAIMRSLIRFCLLS